MKQKTSTMKQELIIRGYSDKTIRAYEFHNDAFLNFIRKSPKDVTASDIKSYVSHLIIRGYGRASINLKISALKFYYLEIMKRKFDVKRMRVEKKLHDVLSKEEVLMMFDSAKNKKHNLILKTLYYTGIRVSELIVIRKTDIDFYRKTLHIRSGKGKKDRFITLQESLFHELERYISVQDKGLLFMASRGRYSTRTIQKICANYAKKAGIIKKITPHTMRRTFATHLLEKGVDISRISKLMGHSRIETTMAYISYAKIPLTAPL